MLFYRARQIDMEFIWKYKYVRIARNFFRQESSMDPTTNA